jgi:glyoxylate reductase
LGLKPKIYVTRGLPPDVLRDIPGDYDIKVWHSTDVPVPYEVLEREVQDAEGLLCCCSLITW